MGKGKARTSPDKLSFPSSNEMADVSDLSEKVLLRYWMNSMFRGIQPPKTSPAAGLVVNFIRLVDKTVREYRYAREALDELVKADLDDKRPQMEAASSDSPRVVFVSVVSPILRVADHLENCITTMKRALDHAHAIRGDQDAPQVEKIELLSPSEYKRLNDFRVAVEHTEPLMLKREIAEGEVITVFVDGQRLVIGKHELPLADLVRWTRKLHALSSRLAAGEHPHRCQP